MQPVNFPVATFNQTNVVVLVFGEQALPDVLVTELAALLHRSAPLNSIQLFAKLTLHNLVREQEAIGIIPERVIAIIPES